jgi:hypothetical protein
MNATAGAMPYDDAWDDANAGEYVEDDGERRDPDTSSIHRRIIEATLKHFGIDAVVWVEERRSDATLFCAQVEDESSLKYILTLGDNLALGLAVDTVTFTEIPERPLAVGILVPKEG